MSILYNSTLKLFIITLFAAISFSCLRNHPDFSKVNVSHSSVDSNLQEEYQHIRKEDQVNFYCNKEANDLTELVVRETFQKWGEVTHFHFTYKGRNRAGLRKDGKNTVSFLLKWPECLPINKVAWCHNWYDPEGNIIESDIIFNMSITVFTTLRTNKPNAYYIEGVLSHEIGHMLGLPHIQSENSLMKPKSDKQESYFKGQIDNETLTEYNRMYNSKE
ncbi:MAG: matrixin family metalloprotease [Spirochaetales bacterium]|nr:matrixin family metalloprotease [Spirochaetales bacterium]